MRACGTVNAVLTGLALAAVGFTACMGDLRSPEPAPRAPASAPLPVPASASAAATGAAPTAEGSGADAGPKAEEPFSDCKDLLSVISNEPPDGGVVMNNAMTAADAGSSDRLQGIIDLMKSKRDAFRCCFDRWARKNPGAQGSIVLVVDLRPDGAVERAAVNASESTVHASEVDACAVDVARSLSYPRSPSGKTTTYSHRFDFKARPHSAR